MSVNIYNFGEGTVYISTSDEGGVRVGRRSFVIIYPFKLVDLLIGVSSWITRVTIRMYPGVTVVETCRLSEWAYFL